MRRTAYYVAIFCLAFLTPCASLAAARGAQAAIPASAPFAGATIADWKGKIQINLPGQHTSVPARNEVLPAGTVLETQDGRLLLRLSDGSQILVGPHTRLQVLQPAPSDRTYFQILIGKIRAFISKQTGGAAPFQLGTPSAVIAVRGTEFEIEVNRFNVTEVDVFAGLVEVTGRGSIERSVLLEPGFSTRVGMDGFPEEPKPTEEIRPEVERTEPGEKDLKDANDLKEIGERRESEVESEISEELERDVVDETSEMLERQEVSESPDVKVEINLGSNQ